MTEQTISALFVCITALCTAALAVAAALAFIAFRSMTRQQAQLLGAVDEANRYLLSLALSTDISVRNRIAAMIHRPSPPPPEETAAPDPTPSRPSSLNDRARI